jgi:hypothetical protein
MGEGVVTRSLYRFPPTEGGQTIEGKRSAHLRRVASKKNSPADSADLHLHLRLDTGGMGCPFSPNGVNYHSPAPTAWVRSAPRGDSPALKRPAWADGRGGYRQARFSTTPAQGASPSSTEEGGAALAAGVVAKAPRLIQEGPRGSAGVVNSSVLQEG